jgi:hypothetical protein
MANAAGRNRKRMCALECTVEQDAGIDSVVDQAAPHCLSG